MIHRPEIDGLRAVAVLPVILFHAGFGAFAGGFVGVDVFFVISGYLITSILVADIEAGRHSILRFYERRARRILPALLVMLAATVPFALAWMLPMQLLDHAESMAAVLLFVSNLYFLTQADYFAPAAELQPLLHTWSLAVEEQYYLLFPPLVALALRGGRRRLLAMTAVLALASFTLWLWGGAFDPERNFFFTFSRLWEIAAGSICAVVMAGRDGPRPRGGLALLGLALILGAVLGPAALRLPAEVAVAAAVAGAAMVVLFAARQTAVARWLSHPLPVGIGLISYSAYLAHQPVFAFLRLRSAEEPGAGAMLAASAAALALGWASWRFVERPFRGARPAALPGRGAFFAAGGAAMAVLGLGAAAIIALDGIAGRARERFAGDIGHSAFYRALEREMSACRSAAAAAAGPSRNGRARCYQSRPDLPATVVVLGDSHAEHLILGVAAALPGEVVASYIQNAPPLADDPQFAPVLAALEHEPELRGVIFAMHWPRRLLQRGGDAAGFGPALAATLDRLQRLRVPVVVAGDLPWFVAEPDYCKFEVVVGKPGYCRAQRRDALAAIATARPLIEAAAAARAMPVVALRDLFCRGGDCTMVRDGALMFRDSNHLNAEGSRLAGAMAGAALAARMAPPAAAP